MLPVRMPWEVALLVLIGVGGCGWPIPVSDAWMGTAYWSLRKIAPVLASAVEAMTVQMV